MKKFFEKILGVWNAFLDRAKAITELDRDDYRAVAFGAVLTAIAVLVFSPVGGTVVAFLGVIGWAGYLKHRGLQKLVGQECIAIAIGAASVLGPLWIYIT